MKKRILTAITVFIVVLMTSGPAVASGCPDDDSHLIENAPTYGSLVPYTVTDGTVVMYLLNTINKPGASLIEYCVYPTLGFDGGENDLTLLYTGPGNFLWKKDYKDSKTFFGFERTHGDPNNLQINGDDNIQIGKVDYLYTSKLPASETILFHIKDPEECGPENTCWRKAGTPPAPVPELGTIALMSTGVLGLVLVSRRYR